MRVFHLILLWVCFCDLLHAQTVQIIYEGDPLTDKERRKIEQTLQYEVEFYSQFGLPDTLNLKLTVFNKREDALTYLDKFNIHPPQRHKRFIYTQITESYYIKQRERISTRPWHHLSRTEPSPHLENYSRASSHLV